MSGSGYFTPETIPAGWFDETLEAEGWFDSHLIEVAVAVPGAYTLSVTTASVTITGANVALRRALRLSVSPAAITLTGSSVGVKLGRKAGVTAASVTLSGQNVATKAARRLTVSPASVLLTGSNVTLRKTGSYRVTVDPGFIVMSGGDVGLIYSGRAIVPGNRGDDAAPRIYYIRKAKLLKEELDRPAPLRKERKQRVIEIQEAIEPVRAELADYAINVDVSAIDARLEAFAQSQLGYASLIAGLNEYLANVERQLQAEQEARDKRRKRNRRIAIAMLLSA
jgi:hypothetical protein